MEMERGVNKNGWRILGPGGGGAQYIPTIKPDDPDTVLVACDMTGVYITHNGGQGWTQINFKAWMRSFAFAPSRPETIYAGGTGLYRSNDIGKNWYLVFPDPSAVTAEKNTGDHAEHRYISSDNWPGGKVETIQVDPIDPNHLLIGVNNGQLILFESMDEGKSWKEKTVLAGSNILRSYLDVNPVTKQQKLFVFTTSGFFEYSVYDTTVVQLTLPDEVKMTDFSAGVLPDSGQPVFFITSPGLWKGSRYQSGVYRSLDRGKTWEEISTGLEADLRPGLFRELNRVATCSTDANTVYVSAVEPGDDASEDIYFGVFKSIDLGKTWQWVLRLGQEQPENRTTGWVEKDYGPTWGGAPFYMSVAPSSPDVCYATDWGTTYRTVDGGKTWQQLYCEVYPNGSASTRGLDVTNINYICFDPFNKDHMVLACTDIGAFHSMNSGVSWSHVSTGVPAKWAGNCYQMLFDPKVNGRAWAVWSDCHDLPRPKMFKSGRLNRYSGGVTRSDNNLESWEKSSKGLPANIVPTDIILDPKSEPGARSLYIAAVGKGVYKSVDDGRSWVKKSNGIHGNMNAWRLIRLPDSTLYLLVCRGLEGERVIDGALYCSKDGAETWQAIELPAGVNFPNDLCFDLENPKRMYLAAWPTTINGSEEFGGLWKTEDAGINWVSCFNKSAHVYGVTIAQDNPETIYLTTFNSSVFRSDDRGMHWKRLGGYNFKWAKQPILDPYHQEMLYLTTFGSSIWYGPANGIDGPFDDVKNID